MATLYDANGFVSGDDGQAGAGVRAVGGLDTNKAKTDPKSPPPKADSAPKASGSYTYTGLCAALNQLEQDLVTAGTVEQANFYEVVFQPESIASSTIKLPGQTDKSMVPMNPTTTAGDKVDQSKQSMNTTGLNRTVNFGTQIIQFIEMTMRNSSFITNQMTEIKDQVSGNVEASNSTAANNTTQWFKINVVAKPVSDKMDTKRNDFAWHMTYLVTPYQINQSVSQYFPEAQFRGVHKVYNYWFTGQNTQVLHYQQEFNKLYYNVINGDAPVNKAQNSALANDVMQSWAPTNVPTTTSGQSDQGAKNDANNPASTLADYLYSLTDQGEITLRIIGDPAWIQQGEVVGVNGPNYNFEGFYPDGTINTDAQQAVFAVNWNSPADYDNGSSGPLSGTGLMNVNANTTGGDNDNLSASQTQQSAAYTATKLKSTFIKGKFEQELKGVLLTNLNTRQLGDIASDTGRPPAKADTNSRATDNPNATKKAAAVTQVSAKDKAATAVFLGGAVNDDGIGYSVGATPNGS